MAFVVPARGDIKLLQLGPVRTISGAVDLWRTGFGVTLLSERAAGYLRQRVWEPIESHIDGAKNVLISSAGPLGRISLAALPGKQPGTYLIEEEYG